MRRPSVKWFVIAESLRNTAVVSKVGCAHPRGCTLFSIRAREENKPRKPSAYVIYIYMHIRICVSIYLKHVICL
jgi:hypothetical protein